MLFKEFYHEIELIDRLEHQFTDINWFISANVGELMPLHLIEAKLTDDDVRHPKYQLIGGGDTNPKTAKHPVTQQSYMGAVLHLEPYIASGHQTCPFATAIYQITVRNLDPQIQDFVTRSPGYQADASGHTFYGFELRSSGMGKVGDTLLPPEQQAQCPVRIKLRLPGANLRDWNTGQVIEINRGQITKTKLVGGCASACLHTAGDPAFAKEKLQGRRRKTEELKTNWKSFMSKILIDIFKLVSAAVEQGHKPVVRLNATSDEAWESSTHRFPSNREETEIMLRETWPKRMLSKYANAIRQTVGSSAKNFPELVSDVATFISGKTLLEIFQNVQFYDYTKNPSRMKMYLMAKNGKSANWPNNYHLTFSLAEGNRELAKKFLADGGTVAAVFNVMKVPRVEGALPKTWAGFPVMDADKHDYRFLDEPGTVAGLRAKGEAKFKSTDFGFVIQPDDPDLDPDDPAVIAAKQYSDDFERRIQSGELGSRPGARRDAIKAAGQKLSLPVLY